MLGRPMTVAIPSAGGLKKQELHIHAAKHQGTFVRQQDKKLLDGERLQAGTEAQLCEYS